MQESILFPDPNLASSDGLVAVGGELSTDYLLAAYSQGIFPWFNSGEPILWWSPEPRMVLFPDRFRIHHSLKQTLNSGRFQVRTDTRFETVMLHCKRVKRKGQRGSWISKDMVKAYTKLHELGWAHSFETFRDNELVGGLYGIAMGKAFFGESMFHLEPDASKVALAALVDYCRTHDFHFIDVQQSTSHLRSLGGEDIPRKKFLEMLKISLEFPIDKGKWNL